MKSDTWHTGIWKRKLESIASGKSKGVLNDVKEMARSKHMLKTIYTGIKYQ